MPVGDDALAVGGIDQDAVRGQFFLPVGSRSDREGARGVEAVALGQVGAGEAVAVVAAVAQIERHDRAVEQAGDPAQRTHPDEAAGAAPTHRFGPGEAAQQAGHGAGDQAGGGDSGGGFLQHPVIAFLAQLLAAGVVLAQEAGQRLFRRIGARAALRGAGGCHLGGDVGAQGDAARAEPGGDGGWGDGGQGCADGALEFGCCAPLHAGGDFLAEQFQKQFGHVQSFSAGSMSVWPKSVPLDSKGSPVSLARA